MGLWRVLDERKTAVSNEKEILMYKFLLCGIPAFHSYAIRCAPETLFVCLQQFACVHKFSIRVLLHIGYVKYFKLTIGV